MTKCWNCGAPPKHDLPFVDSAPLDDCIKWAGFLKSQAQWAEFQGDVEKAAAEERVEERDALYHAIYPEKRIEVPENGVTDTTPVPDWDLDEPYVCDRDPGDECDACQ